MAKDAMQTETSANGCPNLQTEWTEFAPPDSVTVAVTSVLRFPNAAEIQITTMLSKDSSLGYLKVQQR